MNNLTIYASQLYVNEASCGTDVWIAVLEQEPDAVSGMAVWTARGLFLIHGYHALPAMDMVSVYEYGMFKQLIRKGGSVTAR